MNLIDNRQIRVFISSTFKDMQDERNYLLKRTFPKLRMKALERDVTLTELDLRWGITEEESKSGKVVDICLQEIENSIPFFIGIVGNRYGWIPNREDIGQGILDRFPSVENYLNEKLSVTEMEMQYGVLQREEPVHAYFYIKAKESNQDDPEKIANLKKAIKESNYPCSTYNSIEDLANQVEESFTVLLDKLFPKGNLSVLEKERIERRSIISRLSQNYVKEDRNFESLNKFISDENRYLVVTGTSGLGKSALLANWVNIHSHNVDCPINIVPIFIGNGEGPASHTRVIDSLCREISDIYGIQRDVNSSAKTQSMDKELEELFSIVLTKGKKPLLIVLDAVNQLMEDDRAKQLLWLPEANAKVKIIFSTLEDDPTMSVFKHRNYPIFELQPLDLSRKEQMVKSYLHLYGKSLNQDQIDRIINDPQCNNTLVLKTLLDELINFGVYEQLDQKIDEFLLPDSIEDFYQVLLDNYEKEFGEEFIRHILSLISLSFEGLKEDEIIDLMNIAPIYWSQFFCSFNSHLVSSAGVLKFSHSYVRDSVYQRYLSDNKDWVNNCRKEIVDYFKQDRNKRSIANVSYQYHEMGDYKSLHDYILAIDVFKCLIINYDGLILKYWPSIIEHKEGKVSEYIQIFDSYSKEDKFEICQTLFNFCQIYVMDIESALYFAKKSIEMASKDKIHIAYENLAAAYNMTAKYEKAIEYYNKVLDLIKKQSDFDLVKELNILDYIGLNYYHLGEYEKAFEICKDILEKRLKLFDEDSTIIAVSYNNLGMVYGAMGFRREAIDNLLKATNIYINHYGERHSHAVQSYSNLATEYEHLGDFSTALQYAKKAVDISREILGDRHIYTTEAFHTLAEIYSTTCEYDKAIEWFQLSLNSAIINYGERHPETSKVLRDVAMAYLYAGDTETALKYAQKALDIQLSFFEKDNPSVLVSYMGLSDCYMKIGDFEKALEYCYLNLEGSLKAYGDNSPNVAQAYHDIATIYRENKQYDKALEAQKKAISILEKAFNDTNPAVGVVYNDLAIIYHYIGDYSTAIKYYKIALDIDFKNLEPTHREIVNTYDNISYSYRELAEFDNAIEYYKKALSIRLQINGEIHPDTATNYNNLGICYFSKEDFANAVEMFSNAYSIRCKVLNESDQLTIEALNNIAYVYRSTGDHLKSVEFYLKGYEALHRKETEDSLQLVDECNHVYSEYYMLGEYSESLRYAVEGLNIMIRTYGENHENTLFKYYDVGFIYSAMGNYHEATDHFLTAAKIAEQQYGIVELSADAYFQSGKLFMALNDIESAILYTQKSITMFEALNMSDRVEESKHLLLQIDNHDK